MDAEWGLVKEFHKRFGLPTADAPRMLVPHQAMMRADFMMEEILEFRAAADLCGQVDAMLDLVYFALGTLVEMGVMPSELFRIVHDSNMNKVWPSGEVRLDADGKVEKPPGWEAPLRELRRRLDAAADRARHTAGE